MPHYWSTFSWLCWLHAWVYVRLAELDWNWSRWRDVWWQFKNVRTQKLYVWVMCACVRVESEKNINFISFLFWKEERARRICAVKLNKLNVHWKRQKREILKRNTFEIEWLHQSNDKNVIPHKVINWKLIYFVVAVASVVISVAAQAASKKN